MSVNKERNEIAVSGDMIIISFISERRNRDMNCKKCNTALPDGARFCHLCGAQVVTERKTKARGNGQGTVYKRGGTWTAKVTLRYYVDENGKLHTVRRTRGGFATKREAVAALPLLRFEPTKPKQITLIGLYDAWLPTHRAGKSTINCYKAAWKIFRPLWYAPLDEIGIDDLQACVDDCQHGRRTKENAKALIGLLYKYAIPRDLAEKNIGQFIIIDAETAEEKPALPITAVELLQGAVCRVPFAGYVVCHCYLGFRPSELLALTRGNYNADARCFVGGSKTDAGRNRTVPVSKKIQPIVDELIGKCASDEDYVFSSDGGGQMGIKQYRSAFYSALDAIGFNNPVETVNGEKRRKYTPHSCRHTFATMLKDVSAPDKDKLMLIGHTSTEMLMHYQSVDLSHLRAIVDAM